MADRTKRQVCSQHYRHPVLGLISIRTLSTARNVSARWKSHDLLVVTIPRGINSQRLLEIIKEMQPRILAKRPARNFFGPGWSFSTPEMLFEVREGVKDDRFEGTVDNKKRLTTLFAPRGIYGEDPTDSLACRAFSDWVTKVLDNYSRKYATKYLLPMATEMARELGVRPASIEISHGSKVLGRCYGSGRILLSRHLIFYPVELRRLVIAHEFAHLTYLDHSRNFYALLDSYLHGRHAELKNLLKRFKGPFATRK